MNKNQRKEGNCWIPKQWFEFNQANNRWRVPEAALQSSEHGHVCHTSRTVACKLLAVSSDYGAFKSNEDSNVNENAKRQEA